VIGHPPSSCCLESKSLRCPSILQGTLFNYIVGLAFSLVFLLFSGEYVNLPRTGPVLIPGWAYLGGLLGVMTIILSSYITPKISTFYLTLLIFIGQLFTGIIVDCLALGTLSAGKIIGGLLVLAGLAYNLMVDKRQETRAARGLD